MSNQSDYVSEKIAWDCNPVNRPRCTICEEPIDTDNGEKVFYIEDEEVCLDCRNDYYEDQGSKWIENV